MADTLPQPCQTDARRVRAVSIALSHAGGATAVHSPYPCPPDSTDLQADLSLHSAHDRTPRSMFQSSAYDHLNGAGAFVSLLSEGSFQGDPQYCLSSRSSNPFDYQAVEDIAVDTNSVIGHPTSERDLEGQTAAPWTHLLAAQGGAGPIAIGIEHSDYSKSQYLAANVRHRANSSASGQESFRDSAYGTAFGRSQCEVESVDELSAEVMDQSCPTYSTPLFQSGHLPANHACDSSMIAQGTRTSIGTAALSESGQPTPSRPVNRSKRSAPLWCFECKYAAKTRSDFKKHNARHERRHRCEFPACVGKSKGFATKNDLDRHLKSVHHVNNRETKYYKCFADGCPRADREWPRLDNFKQHLQKMHKDRDPAHLLELSERWYGQQQQLPPGHQENGGESNDVDTILPSGSVTPVLGSQDDYQNNCPAPAPSCDTSMTMDNPMARSLSFGDQFLGHTMDPTTTTSFPPSQRNHRRNISQPSNVSMLQRPFQNTSSYADNSSAPEVSMQRTQSHFAYPTYPNDTQFANPFDPMIFQSSQSNFSTGFERSGPLMTTNHSFRYDAELDRVRRVRAPHTVAALDSDRMAELAWAQEAQPAMFSDLSDTQDELLLNIGGSTANTTTAPDFTTSPDQRLAVNVFSLQKHSQPTETPISKLLEEEINSFLLEHNAKSEEGRVAMSQEELIDLVRASLRSVSTSAAAAAPREGSTVGTSTVAPTPETSKDKKGREKTGFRCPAEGCNKVKARQSDLTKHIARHERPYGCTADRCHKTFGSKNDWKRHEQAKHEQFECWLCVACHEVFYDSQDSYILHMRDIHPHSPSRDVQDDAPHFHIAANYQGHFWCGFCNEIIRQNKHGVDAVNARFDHIGNHFTKDKCRAKTWIELTGGGKRKEDFLQPENSSVPTQTDNAGEDMESVLFSSTLSVSPSSASSPDSPSLPLPGMSPLHQPTSSMPTSHRETRASASAPAQTDMDYQTQTSQHLTDPQDDPLPEFRHANIVVCCHCKKPSAIGLSYTCMYPSCLHQFCPLCRYKHKQEK